MYLVCNSSQAKHFLGLLCTIISEKNRCLSNRLSTLIFLNQNAPLLEWTDKKQESDKCACYITRLFFLLVAKRYLASLAGWHVRSIRHWLLRMMVSLITLPRLLNWTAMRHTTRQRLKGNKNNAKMNRSYLRWVMCV